MDVVLLRLGIPDPRVVRFLGSRGLWTLGTARLAVDHDKVAADEKFDGIFVLRTNIALDPIQAMLRYKQLWAVEQVFRTTKDILGTRPIHHKRDETIRGHVCGQQLD